MYIYTSSGNQTPGCVLPSRTASTNAAVAFPTDLQDVSLSQITSKAYSSQMSKRNFLFQGQFLKLIRTPIQMNSLESICPTQEGHKMYRENGKETLKQQINNLKKTFKGSSMHFIIFHKVKIPNPQWSQNEFSIFIGSFPRTTSNTLC